MKMFKEITVIGGAGHVGLAFAIICASKNIKVHIHDTNIKSIKLIKKGIMPHEEKKSKKLLKKIIKKNYFSFSSCLENIKISKINVVCLGTPVDEFLNPKHNIIINLFNKLIKYLKSDQHIIIRSTVSPGTTDFLFKFFKKNKKNINLSFCPERFVQGFAFEEFNKFPQIMGSVDKKSENECYNFIKLLSNDIIKLKPIEAELTKLFLNSYRYIQFSIANQFFKIADNLDLDYAKIHYAMNHNYERGKVPSPGLTSGPCLFKDTMQLYSFAKNDFSLGINAMTTNEGIVTYIVDKLKNEINLSNKVVGILGMAFKAEIDDKRSSLSYKLKKILLMNSKKVLTTDPFVKDDDEIISLEKTLKNSDILILATPHKIYKKIKTKKLMIDNWNLIN
jgi:UDP-N-acetyl-D-mannosaminuronic acid dehydrogenase